MNKITEDLVNIFNSSDYFERVRILEQMGVDISKLDYKPFLESFIHVHKNKYNHHRVIGVKYQVNGYLKNGYEWDFRFHDEAGHFYENLNKINKISLDGIGCRIWCYGFFKDDIFHLHRLDGPAWDPEANVYGGSFYVDNRKVKKDDYEKAVQQYYRKSKLKRVLDE